MATWHPGDYAVCALTAPIDLLVVMDARDLEMNSRMLGGPGVSVRGLCPLPGVGALVHVRAAPRS